MPRALFAVLLATSMSVLHAGSVVDSANFTETSYATGLSTITGMAWAPDGSKLIVTQKDGIVRVIKNGTLVTTPFATITPVFTSSECGVIGLCFDPAYATNKYVYFFVTVSASEQQIIRYTDNNDVGDTKTVILGSLPTTGNNHDGGGIAIGPDNKIYFAIGDLGNGTGVDADLTTLASKIGRCNLDGSVPADNPFKDDAGPNNDFIFARGFRNPFTITFQNSTGKLWVNCVGNSYEQVFLVESGIHAGWNDFENNQPTNFILPRIKYRTNGRDTRTIAAAPGGAVRAANVITITTTGAHGFRKGEKITIAGVAATSFNGDVFVASTPTDTTFTATQAGTNESSGGGTAATQTIGGSITGGTFYQGLVSTQVVGDTNFSFPAQYDGNFFFGDFNSGRIMRATLNASDNSIVSVDEFVTGVTNAIDIAEGPDGALYYCNFGGTVFRLVPNTTNPPPVDPNDDDGDGVSNANEIAAGTNPLDANSFLTTAFTATKLTGSVKFGMTGKDKCSVSGIIPALPAGFTPEGKTVQVIVAGASVPFVLNDKAAQKKDDKSAFSVKLKPSTRNKTTKAVEFLGGDVAFKATLPGTFSSTWSDEGVVANVKETTRLSFRVDIAFNGTRYRTDVPVDFKSSDKSASIKKAKE